MRPLRILVVDDEQGIRDLLRDAFAQKGHNVTCAENGVEAIARVASSRVDAVFLDVRMPKGDGLTALKEMKTLWPSLPVVMITGCNQCDFTKEAFRLGTFACLIKPFSVRDLVAMLDVLQTQIEDATIN